MQFISKLLLFSYGTYLLRNKMGIKTSQIMENNWDLVLFWVNPQYQITVLIRRSPVLPSNVTMIPDRDICFLILLATNMALFCSLKHLFLLISHIQRLLEFRTKRSSSSHARKNLWYPGSKSAYITKGADICLWQFWNWSILLPFWGILIACSPFITIQLV